MLIIEIEKRHNKMVDRIRYPTVSYLPFYYVFFQFLLLTIFNLQANILTTKDILSNLAHSPCPGPRPPSSTSPGNGLRHRKLSPDTLFYLPWDNFMTRCASSQIIINFYYLCSLWNTSRRVFLITCHRYEHYR